MALEGSLKEFGLADILQLIYYQRKTGVLALDGRLDKVRILFHEGKIVSAESKKRAEEGRLGKILIRKGAITDAALSEAMKEQRSAGMKLGHVLIKKGLVRKEQIQEILASQITEIITQLFSWKEGRYEFKPQGVPVDKEIPLSLDTQHILMEGLRIVDEWSLIEGKIDLDTVFVRTGAGGDSLSDIERELLGYVDGEIDVSAIADLSGRDNFEVSKALVSLLEKGVIVRKEPAGPEEEAPAKPLLARLPIAGVFVGVAVITAVVLSWFAFSVPDVDLRSWKASERLDALRFEAEVHFYDKGSYPLSLPRAGLDPWGQPYVYALIENGYTLLSPGPDGKPGTPDDIR